MGKSFCYEYPRPAVAVDVVVQSRDGHVLLVRRRNEPYKGRWALPGGFVEIDERLADAAVRELAEEAGLTGLELRPVGVFDEPGRDPRGRTISVAFSGRVGERSWPRAGSDAADARWIPLDDLPPTAFDHDRIIAAARNATG
jgi:8-oxo-dGTP diphosphatase